MATITPRPLSEVKQAAMLAAQSAAVLKRPSMRSFERFMMGAMMTPPEFLS
jgi:hypothetical protein